MLKKYCASINLDTSHSTLGCCALDHQQPLIVSVEELMETSIHTNGSWELDYSSECIAHNK